MKQSRRRAVPCSELFWLTQPKTRKSSEHGVALVWGEPAGRKLLSSVSVACCIDKFCATLLALLTLSDELNGRGIGLAYGTTGSEHSGPDIYSAPGYSSVREQPRQVVI